MPPFTLKLRTLHVTHTHTQNNVREIKTKKKKLKKTNKEAGIVFVPNGSIDLSFPWFLHLTCLLTSLNTLSLVLYSSLTSFLISFPQFTFNIFNNV